jgi:hypothetical protein
MRLSRFPEDQPMSCSNIYLGPDVHKESATIAVLPRDRSSADARREDAARPGETRRYFRRLASACAELRAC